VAIGRQADARGRGQSDWQGTERNKRVRKEGRPQTNHKDDMASFPSLPLVWIDCEVTFPVPLLAHETVLWA